MTVEDSATAEIRCGDMANNATAEFALGLKDNATLKIGDNGGNINFGNNSGGKIDFTMTGGSLESYSGGEANVIGFRGGPASTYTIAGGTITTKSIVIEGVQNDDVVARTGYTNTVRMTGGTVDTLTLGDGHGFDVLKLDAGDTVIVEAANGITANCGAIDVPWKSTEGTHAVFTCKQGVVVGELDKIAVHDGDATKDYAWTTEIDAGTGYTICSVTVAPKGTLTKTITYSSGTVTTNGTGVEITKTGSGKLVLGGGTFLYSGSDPLVFNGALRIAAPEHKRPVVIDNAGDVTFTSTEYVQGLFIKKGGSAGVFIGDSIVHGLEGSAVWREKFAGAPFHALNLGFSGDRTEHVLWRLDHGELDGYKTKVVVNGKARVWGEGTVKDETAIDIAPLNCAKGVAVGNVECHKRLTIKNESGTSVRVGVNGARKER